MLKKFIITVFICADIFILNQFTSAESNNSPKDSANTFQNLTEKELTFKKDSIFSIINEKYQTVKPIIKHSCFDCHSQKTAYPWYYKLPIIKGMIDDDIKEAREHLDFSNDFPFKSKHKILPLLNEIKIEVKEKDMPLWSYRLIHRGTTIKGKKMDSLFQWIDYSTTMLINFYQQANIPFDTTDEDED
ncbi:MAG: heme-binding domain-containing protein [FCB group bacterium]|nr:heme-binding domain-containing protein [FCB group bacterium]